MKRTKHSLFPLVLGSLLCLLCCACEQDNSRKLNVTKVQRKTCMPLGKDSKNPSCRIEIVLEKATAPQDIARKVNQAIIRQVFGFEDMETEAAADSFINESNRKYITDCAVEYAARTDLGNEWYNYRYYIRAEEKSDYPNIITYETLVEQKKGNARKSANRQYLNFDARTGEPLSLADLFKPGYERVIVPLMMKALQKKFNCVSMAQLNKQGVLRNNKLYVPENFRPGNNEVKFLFNESEIASYKTGEITLSIPRTLLEQVIKFK